MTHVPKEQLPFIHLTETAAIWVLYTLDGYRHRGATVSPVSRFTPLGVTQWQSYAAFRAGVHWQQDGQTDKAHSLYQHALQLDAKNRGALLDLGILETKDKHYDQALEHLQEAQQAAIAAEQAYRAGEKFHTDTVWYVATYQLAATYDYMDMPRRWQQAKEQARSLVDMVKQADALLAHPRPVVKSDLEARYAEEDQQLATFLKRIKPLTMLLYASILVRGTTADDREQAERLMMEIAPGELKDPRVQYNLAACYSRKGQAVTAQARTDAYTQALQHLDLAFACATRDARQRLVSWARVDPSFDGVRDGMYDQFLRLVNKYTS
jgi:tetratricopeptide (TPR) repeat protein